MFADRSRQPSRQAGSLADGPTGIPTVVIGVDGSSTSWDAFCWGCGEARRMGGRVVAVFTSTGYTSPNATNGQAPEHGSAMMDGAMDRAGPEQGPEQDPEQDPAQAEQLAAEIRQEAGDLGVDLSFIHARGHPAIELLRIAKVVGADLIVVGKSAKPRHRLVGSVGQRLIRRHATPVVVVVP